MNKIRLALLALSFAGLLSCQKNAENAPTAGKQQISARTTVMNGGDKNYCQGCSYATVPGFHCVGHQCLEGDVCNYDAAMAFVPSPDPTQQKETEDMYTLRDEFMINFELGRWYITYYYELSKISEDNKMITSNNYLEYLRFGSDLLAAGNKLRSGANEEIVISPELRVRAIEFLNRFRVVTKDEIIIGYLNSIQEDLNSYTGKTVGELRTILGVK